MPNRIRRGTSDKDLASHGHNPNLCRALDSGRLRRSIARGRSESVNGRPGSQLIPNLEPLFARFIGEND